MLVERRRFLRTTAGAALSLVAGSKPQAAESTIDSEKLDRAATRPVLKRDLFASPATIQSVELLRARDDYFVRVRSKDGAEGVSVTNSRAAYLHPILNKLVIPYFLKKDARDLETHLWEVYRYRSNYKLQGLALWCPLAWVEFAVLDMLGRIAGSESYWAR